MEIIPTNTENRYTDAPSAQTGGTISQIADRAKDEAKAVAGEAMAVAGEAKDQALEAAAKAKEQAKEAIAQTKQKAGELAERTRGQVKDQLSTQKENAAGSLGGFATALQQAGDQLRDQNQNAVGDYARAAADQVERVSGYLRDNNVDQVVRDTEDFARRQPALFLGGAFLLGVFASRFLKSSQRNVVTSGAYTTSEREGALVPIGTRALVTPATPVAHGYVPGGIAGSGMQPPADVT